MDLASLLFNIGTFLLVLLTLGLKTYTSEKGKNLATKEDIKEITQKTEEVKADFNAKLMNLTEEVRLKKYKEQQVYIKKFNAINNSLQFIDTYLSWLRFGENPLPVREDITEAKLTVRGRNCYNELAITCDNKEILDIFLKILFDEDAEHMKLFNEFRNIARKELGIHADIDFNKERVFLSQISTNDLRNNIKH